jgi:hypothetical protein
MVLATRWLATDAKDRPRSGESAAPLNWRALGEPGVGGTVTGMAVSPTDSNRILIGGDILGAGVSEDGAQSWQPAFGFASWEMADFTFNPTNANEVWVGTMSGPYVSEDGGHTWESSRTGFPPIAAYSYSAPVEKVLFDPNNPARLVALGGSHRRYPSPGQPLWGAVWQSVDGGATWSQISTIAGGGNVMAAAFAAGSSLVLYAAVDQKGVYASADGGTTWTAANAGLPALTTAALAVDPVVPGTLYVGLDSYSDGQGGYLPGGIFKSTDGAATWQASSTGLPQGANAQPTLSSSFEAIVVALTNPSLLYTSDIAYNEAGIFQSSDGGATWQAVMNSTLKANAPTAFVSGPGFTVLAMDPSNPQSVYAAGSEYALASHDRGATWSDVTSKPVPGTTRWQGRGYEGFVAVNFAFNPQQPDFAVLLGMDDGKFWQSRDGFSSWQWGGEGLDHWGGGNDVTFTGPGGSTMYVTFGQEGTYSGIGKTTDGGQMWTVLAGSAQGLPALNASSAQPMGIYALPTNPNQVWATIGGELYTSTDGGANWQVINTGPGLEWIAADPVNPLAFYVNGSAGVYRTADGANFTLLPGSPTNTLRLVMDPNDSSVLYATQWRQSPGGLWQYAQGAWKLLRSDPFISNVAVDPLDTQHLVVSTADDPYHDVSSATGIWVSADGGASWSQQNQGLSMLRGAATRFNPFQPGQLVFGAQGRGFFLADSGATPQPMDFSLTPAPASATVTGGQSANFTLSLAPSSGFARTVRFGCLSSSSSATCSISPAAVSLAGGTGTATLTVATNTGAGSPSRRPWHGPLLPWPWMWLVIAASGITISAYLARRRRVAVGLATLLALLWMAACGGGAASSQPPPPSSPLLVTVSVYAASGGILHTTAVSVTVN